MNTWAFLNYWGHAPGLPPSLRLWFDSHTRVQCTNARCLYPPEKVVGYGFPLTSVKHIQNVQIFKIKTHLYTSSFWTIVETLAGSENDWRFSHKRSTLVITRMESQ